MKAEIVMSDKRPADFFKSAYDERKIINGKFT